MFIKLKNDEVINSKYLVRMNKDGTNYIKFYMAGRENDILTGFKTEEERDQAYQKALSILAE